MYCHVGGTSISTCPTSQLRTFKPYSSSTTNQSTKLRPSRINIPRGPRNLHLEYSEPIKQCTVMSVRHTRVSGSQIILIRRFKTWAQNLLSSPHFCILNCQTEHHAYFHVDISFLGVLIISVNREVRKLFYY
jgi:hypothetical protein